MKTESIFIPIAVKTLESPQNTHRFLLLCKGYKKVEDWTWEPASTLEGVADDLIAAYEVRAV